MFSCVRSIEVAFKHDWDMGLRKRFQGQIYGKHHFRLELLFCYLKVRLTRLNVTLTFRSALPWRWKYSSSETFKTFWEGVTLPTSQVLCRFLNDSVQGWLWIWNSGQKHAQDTRDIFCYYLKIKNLPFCCVCMQIISYNDISSTYH